LTRDDRRVELSIAIVPALLVLLTIVIVVDPRIAPAIVNLPLDVVTTATGMLVALAVAILGWIHFPGGDRPGGADPRQRVPSASGALIGLSCGRCFSP
jgi:hypothetical protein